MAWQEGWTLVWDHCSAHCPKPSHIWASDRAFKQELAKLVDITLSLLLLKGPRSPPTHPLPSIFPGQRPRLQAGAGQAGGHAHLGGGQGGQPARAQRQVGAVHAL